MSYIIYLILLGFHAEGELGKSRLNASVRQFDFGSESKYQLRGSQGFEVVSGKARNFQGRIGIVDAPSRADGFVGARPATSFHDAQFPAFAEKSQRAVEQARIAQADSTQGLVVENEVKTLQLPCPADLASQWLAERGLDRLQVFAAPTCQTQ